MEKIKARIAHWCAIFWIAFAQRYLAKRYNEVRIQLTHALHDDIERGVVRLITTADAVQYTEREHTMGLTSAEDHTEQWYEMPGGIGRIETLEEYAARWYNWKLAPDRKTKKRRWFWQVPQHAPKMYYRPKYHEPIFQQVPILSDAAVYNHAKENGVDVSKFFVTSGGTGKNNPLTVVCTALRWKDEYVETHMRDLDPDREEDDAATA